MNTIKRKIEEIIRISNEEWSLIKKLVVPQKIKAKTKIIDIGSIAREIFFIEQGLLRVYHLKDGKEISTYFACDNQFISTFASIISHKPSYEFLETITDSTVLKINYQQLQQLFEKVPKFEKLGRAFAEQNFLCIADRTIVMQTMTAKDKYLNFINTYDEKIIMNVPQHQIASYLGITPESLSRIRKEIATSV